ncbi:Major facilitator superfamily domain general substrate transporter [Penicillium solitum]|uniref:Major facilitator superfamily domain general substrate transporter n=1 Tax=Penicillium solitum TaxID=60172 RepID=UPI0032C4212D|nr:Major facilitator superfamily domain general substrate transporter [Penicillium solitum]
MLRCSRLFSIIRTKLSSLSSTDLYKHNPHDNASFILGSKETTFDDVPAPKPTAPNPADFPNGGLQS